jgi:hypothetical protein
MARSPPAMGARTPPVGTERLNFRTPLTAAEKPRSPKSVRWQKGNRSQIRGAARANISTALPLGRNSSFTAESLDDANFSNPFCRRAEIASAGSPQSPPMSGANFFTFRRLPGPIKLNPPDPIGHHGGGAMKKVTGNHPGWSARKSLNVSMSHCELYAPKKGVQSQ